MVRSYLERYITGEHREVWAELAALGERVRQEPLFSDAGAVARETMRRVAANIDTLVDRLTGMGYQFGVLPARFGAEAYYNLKGFAAPRIPPEPASAERIRTVEGSYGPLPISVRAWYEVVGTVDLRGHHPVWAEFIDYSDPLVVQPLEPQPPERAYGIPEPADRYRGMLLLFPDKVLKEDQAGVSAIFALLPWPEFDTPLWFEGEPLRWPPYSAGEIVLFLDYLRHCLLQWGGFVGFDTNWSGEGFMGMERLRQETAGAPPQDADEERLRRWRALRRLRDDLERLPRGLIPF